MSLARSGIITCTGGGTAVQGTDNRGHLFALAAHPDNTDTVWVGNDGAADVASSNGYPLTAQSSPVIVEVSNLNEMWFDADVADEKVCWLRLDLGPY